MSNITNTTVLGYSNLTNFVIAPFCIATITVNIFFLTMGIRTLKKNAHNMLVISMCFGDCLYAFALLILAVRNIILTDGAYTEFCMSHIALMFISMSMSLTFAFMICVERFISIKTKNFGILPHSEVWKKRMSITAILLTTSYVTVCFIFLPIRPQQLSSKECDMRLFYDPYNYQVIMSLLSGLFLILISVISVLYMRVVCMLCQFKGIATRVAPQGDAHIQRNKMESRQITYSNNRQVLCTGLVSILHRKEIDVNDKNSVKQKQQAYNSQQNKNNLQRTINVDEDPISVSNIQITHCTFDDISSTSLNDDYRSSMNRDSFESSTVSSAFNNQNDQSFNRSNEIHSKSLYREWELRAFGTSGCIIGSTLLLNGPLITCLIADATNNSLHPSIGYIAAFLVAFQCVINPFIYSLRFKELRKAIRNVLCCKMHQTPSTMTGDFQAGLENRNV